MKVDNQGERFFLRVRRDDYSDRDVAAFDRKSMVVDLIFYVYATWISMQEYMCPERVVPECMPLGVVVIQGITQVIALRLFSEWPHETCPL